LSEQVLHIFFSPHADDVVLSCGGTIHSLLSEGQPVEVISVFAGQPDRPRYSAYARHLHAKWHLTENPIEQRWSEDTSAMKDLGLTTFRRWDYLEAPYRAAVDGSPLYCVNEDLTGPVAVEDKNLRDDIGHRVRTRLEGLPDTTKLYFPLSLGRHVDHQILYDVGLELCANSKQVQFYEDFPYAEKYKVNGHGKAWMPKVVSVTVEARLRAGCAYVSQIRGLGGSPRALEKRLRAFATLAGDGTLGERYWTVDASVAQEFINGNDLPCPHALREVRPRLGDFGRFAETFKWHDLDEILPFGDGRCLDVGCGSGRHRSVVEERGYTWLGVDRNSFISASVCSDAGALPLSANSVAAVTAWQVLEYVEEPELLVEEAARVLEPGGVFCGSASFLEPVHGRTLFNLSPLILERLLRKNGFADVEIKPGLNGFVLLLWTWLRRCGIPYADRLAVPAIILGLGPLAALVFLTSWLRLLIGRGDGHTMRWLTEAAPLEFAGHVMFVARKTTRGTERA
jgi:LmbE family N-acetylglucosaminyl deacetylase